MILLNRAASYEPPTTRGGSSTTAIVGLCLGFASFVAVVVLFRCMGERMDPRNQEQECEFALHRCYADDFYEEQVLGPATPYLDPNGAGRRGRETDIDPPPAYESQANNELVSSADGIAPRMQGAVSGGKARQLSPK